MIKGIKQQHLWLIWLLAAVITFTAGFLMGNYWLRVWTSVLMYIAITQGLNVIVGFAGYHSFGNSAFFGTGAYIAAILLVNGWPLWAALPVTTLGGALLVLLLGPPLLRLKGHYFAIATVVLNAVMAELILNVGGFTGGAQGISLPLSELSPITLYRQVYLLMFVGAVVASLIVFWLSRSKFGYAVRASKDSEDGAKAMGINTTAIRVGAWMLSGAITAYVGGVWAYWINFIEVGSAFDISLSVKAYIMLLMGGVGTVVGPILGAAFFEIVSTLVWSKFSTLHNLILGILICGVILFIPRGIVIPVKNYFFAKKSNTPK